MGIEPHREAAAPDWHPDPAGRHQYRYWDGKSWTDHVSDNGQQAVDPLGAALGQSGTKESDDAVPETASEPVLLTIRNARDAGLPTIPLVNVYLTDRRMLVEYLTSRKQIGAYLAGGVVGTVIAGNVQAKRVKEADSPVRTTVDEILHSPNEVRAIDYCDVTKMLLRRNRGDTAVLTLRSTHPTLNASKSVGINFGSEMFDEASELLVRMMPGRVTVK